MIGQWQERELKWIKNREKEEYYRGLKSEWPREEKKIRTGRTKTLGSKVTKAHRNLVRSRKLEMTNYLHSPSKSQGVLCVFHVQQKNLHCLTISFGVEKKMHHSMLVLHICLVVINNTLDIKVMPLKIQFLISPEFALRNDD